MLGHSLALRNATSHLHPMNRPNKIEALSGYRLRIAYPDGTAGVIDLSADVGRGVFAPLADEEFFKPFTSGASGKSPGQKTSRFVPMLLTKRLPAGRQPRQPMHMT